MPPLPPRIGARRPARLAALAALLVLCACVSTPDGEARQQAPMERPPTILVVENRSFLDATIYVVRSG